MVSLQAILCVMPVVSSSMIMQSNFDQQCAFRSFLHTKVPVGARAKVLPAWYQAFLYPGVPFLGLLYGLGFSAELVLHFGKPEADPDRWFLWCAVFTAAHALFMPWAWEGIRGTSDESVTPEGNVRALRKWLVVSLIRLVVADIPAWVCAILGLARCIDI